MTGADIVILVIIGISALLSLVRGFIKEALSLVTWIAAFWVSLAFTDRAADLLANWVSLPSARAALAFAGLFVAVLLLGGLVNYLIGQLVRKTGLGGTDRMLGMVFGVLRGVMVVAVLVLLAALVVGLVALAAPSSLEAGGKGKPPKGPKCATCAPTVGDCVLVECGQFDCVYQCPYAG